jgi:hypothetical protein
MIFMLVSDLWPFGLKDGGVKCMDGDAGCSKCNELQREAISMGRQEGLESGRYSVCPPWLWQAVFISADFILM